METSEIDSMLLQVLDLKRTFSEAIARDMDRGILKELFYHMKYYKPEHDELREKRKLLHIDDSKYAIIVKIGNHQTIAWKGRDTGKVYKGDERVQTDMEFKRYVYVRDATSFDF